MKRCVDRQLVGSRRGYSAILSVGLMAAVLTHSQQVQADNLISFIKNLYGGQGITLADTDRGFPSHAHHFTPESVEQLNSLGNSIASNLNLTSFPSTAVGYTYDIGLGLPVRTTESLGPIIGERSETLGAGKLNIAATYSHESFTSFNGTSLSGISLLLNHGPIEGCPSADIPGCDFIKDQIRLAVNLNISQDVFAFYSTYGITSNWDATLIVPVVHTHAVATSDATIIYNSVIGPLVHTFIGAPTSPHSVSGGDATGIGDLILHTKYNFLKGDPSLPDAAVAGVVKVPSGDKDNFLGTGSTDLLPLLILSKQIDWAAPHLNAGYQWAFGGLDKNAFIYAAGADFRMEPRVTTAVDFVGRVFSGGPQLHDISLGIKWNPFGNSVFDVNFLVPLNRSEGLRPNFVASVGYQITF